jgi:hypothetical protein
MTTVFIFMLLFVMGILWRTFGFLPTNNQSINHHEPTHKPMNHLKPAPEPINPRGQGA